MKLIFKYDREKDISCLLEYGPGSNNNAKSTKVFEQLIKDKGENPDREYASEFVDKYLVEGEYNIPVYLEKYQESFNTISSDFIEIAERVFGVSLEDDITAYLTINGRCPYNLENNYFLVTILDKPEYSPNSIAIHEIWHFYTWKKYGKDWIEKIGYQKYNDIKESLTVLLNIECMDLMKKEDLGYPQHQELRKRIVELWEEKQDIDYVWNESLKFIK